MSLIIRHVQGLARLDKVGPRIPQNAVPTTAAGRCDSAQQACPGPCTELGRGLPEQVSPVLILSFIMHACRRVPRC